MRTGRSLAALACVLALGQTALSDIITMRNGRTFEGRILEQTPTVVRADVKVGGIRIQASVARAKVASIEKKPLPEGFFDAGAVDAASGSALPSGGTAYLEIPVTGTIGTEVTTAGITRCLNYAAGQRIGHIVFVIDSRGGDLDAARAIRDALQYHVKRLTYHCIIRRAEGEALIFPIFCKTILLAPDARLGAVKLTVDPSKLRSGQTVQILRAQAARRAGEFTESRGFPGDVVRAMIDPAYNLSGWTEEGKEIHLAESPPRDLPTNRLVFSDSDAAAVLTLTGKQAAAIRFGRLYTGDASGIGKLLGLAKWTSAGDYGPKAMTETAAREARRKQAEAAAFEDSVQRTIQRRETVKAYIDANMKDADKYDPTKKGSYRQRRSYDWNDHQIITTDRVRNEFTDRAAIAIRALRRANSGIKELIGLEKTAEKLGLSPSSSPDDLANQANSNGVRIRLLEAEAKRRSHIIRD